MKCCETVYTCIHIHSSTYVLMQTSFHTIQFSLSSSFSGIRDTQANAYFSMILVLQKTLYVQWKRPGLQWTKQCSISAAFHSFASSLADCALSLPVFHHLFSHPVLSLCSGEEVLRKTFTLCILHILGNTADYKGQWQRCVFKSHLTPCCVQSQSSPCLCASTL